MIRGQKFEDQFTVWSHAEGASADRSRTDSRFNAVLRVSNGGIESFGTLTYTFFLFHLQSDNCTALYVAECEKIS